MFDPKPQHEETLRATALMKERRRRLKRFQEDWHPMPVVNQLFRQTNAETDYLDALTMLVSSLAIRVIDLENEVLRLRTVSRR